MIISCCSLFKKKKTRRYLFVALEEMTEMPVRFPLNAGTALLPEVEKQKKWASPLSYVRKIHLAPLASCPGSCGMVYVFSRQHCYFAVKTQHGVAHPPLARHCCQS